MKRGGGEGRGTFDSLWCSAGLQTIEKGKAIGWQKKCCPPPPLGELKWVARLWGEYRVAKVAIITPLSNFHRQELTKWHFWKPPRPR